MFSLYEYNKLLDTRFYQKIWLFFKQRSQCDQVKYLLNFNIFIIFALFLYNK